MGQPQHTERAAPAAPAIPVRAYVELAKPRILVMVLVSAMLGFFLAGGGLHAFPVLMAFLVGTAMVSGGAAALNHCVEREPDSLMERTRMRPIPAGVIALGDGFLFGAGLIASGAALLLWYVNPLTAALALVTAALYVFVYTPLKQVSWLNTLVGAVPGAIPPLGGWAAATGRLDAGAWALFLILFLWQQPHFFAIAWMFRDDYRRGGFQMLPSLKGGEGRTIRQILFFLALLIPASLAPYWLGLTGPVYAVGAVLLGLWFFASGAALARSHSLMDARRVLRVSVIYLPLLLFLIAADAAWF